MKAEEKETITYWCDDIDILIDMYQTVWSRDGWRVLIPVKIKWKWSRFEWVFVLKLFKYK